MKELNGKSVKLWDGEFLRRERENRAYLLKLSNGSLLRSFELEAGTYSGSDDTDNFGGWESLTCQLRGHFLGHWLSGAAIHYDETGNMELYGKTSAIIDRLEICQRDNGGEWVCSIPEKYLYWIGRGKSVWAPQYTIHKLLMGLVDVYKFMHIEKALEIADKLGDWFYRWSGEYTREQFDNILDFETGGVLESWVDLYEITGKKKYLELMQRYYRGRLFDPLLEGKDALTNMHANTTIPEILGCARAYEVTGEEKWLDIVKAYWKCGVTDRGFYATGGQTHGEMWTPKLKLKARLGEKNQEHCTVYNMIRLAEFLFRMTKDPEYMHYIEYNVHNGVMAQTYFAGEPYKGSPTTALLAYFLPMKAGSKKDWSGETDSFFCCHGTMVQANAAWNKYIYYTEGNDVYITQYVGSEASFELSGKKLRINIYEDQMNGTDMESSENTAKQTVNDDTSKYASKPQFKKYVVTVIPEEGSQNFALKLRIPDWIKSEATVSVNDTEILKTKKTDEFVTIEREWNPWDRVTVLAPIGLDFITLPDDESYGAYRYGPDVLVGITDCERILHLKSDDPTTELTSTSEREWGVFKTHYKTENQEPGINFKKINAIGYEPYQMYFKVVKD